MASRLVHRPARAVRPTGAEPAVPISPPPVLPDGRSGPNLMSILPLAGAGGGMGMMMFLRGSTFAALGAVILVVALFAAAAFYFTQRGQGARKRRSQREMYLNHLEELRDRLRAEEVALRARLLRTDPPVSHLLDIVADPARRWERRRADPDFLRIRVGVGAPTVRDMPLRDEGTPVAPTDPFMRSEAESVARRFSRVAGVPLRVALDRAGDVSVVGPDRAEVLAVVRSLLLQVAVMHAPEDVTIAVVAPPAVEADWAWARWLPHLLDRSRAGEGPMVLLAPDPPTLAALLGADLAARSAARGTDPRLRARLLVVDDAGAGVAHVLPLAEPRALGVTVLHLVNDRLHEPGEVSARVHVGGGGVLVEHLGGPLAPAVPGQADHTPLALAEGLARRLAPLRLAADSLDDGTGTPPADAVALLGLSDPAVIDTVRLWRPRPERDVLRVPLGVDPAGRPVLLDLKEAAALGMGPHGLCVGATGSGKSELLRTIVLGLAAGHPPEQLAMVLVDYKGGATFAPFGALPHVAGLVTNLAADATLVDRVHTSLDGEVLRRQQLLADAGGATDVTEYAIRRAARPELPALPSLLVIIDEFGELLVARPDFAELLLRIGRIGRSIGVHLLLAGQRIETGKMRGLETHLSYRIGLRTLSEQESRTVLDTPDAFALPALPGHAYLKVDTSVYQRFRAGYVSGLLHPPEEDEPPPGPRVRPAPRFGSPPVAPTTPAPRPARRGAGPTLLSTVVDGLVAAGAPVAPVWLAPLPSAVALDTAGGGWDARADGIRLVSAPRVVVGLLDDPARQWQGPWTLDLDAGAGHHLIVGGPGSGTTTALRTVALALATARTPAEFAIYGVDLTGAGLRDLAGLPHVGGIAGRDDPERVRRTVDEVAAMLGRREKLFAEHGVDTIADVRAGSAPEVAAALPSTEVVLLLDGWGALGAAFEPLAPTVFDVLARGGRYGVHVVATARRWNEIRAAQQVAFAARTELRLTDPAESTVDGRLARAVPTDVPGRALTTSRRYAQFALPRLDGLTEPGGLAAAAQQVRGAWTGPLPPPVRVLPAVLPLTDLDGAAGGPGVTIGRDEADLGAAAVDLFGRDQHVMVLGDGGSGRTNLLRVLATSLVRRFGPDELVLAVYDPRRGLGALVPEEHLGGYAPNPALAARLTAAVCTELARRDAGETPPTPRIVLLVDDHDVLTAASVPPLAGFVPFLAGGRDLGLHVVVTRRVMGAARAMYDPFLLGVRESGCLGLMLSGDRGEGKLLGGVRPEILPPGRARLIRPGAPVRTVQTAYWGEP